MKFKQSEEPEKETNSLQDEFANLIQFEITKLSLITSAKLYFYKEGLMDYKKFFKYLYKSCEEIKHCLTAFAVDNDFKLGAFEIPKLVTFSDIKEPFKQLADMEDEFEDRLNTLINLAVEDKNWKVFHYLLKKLDTIDHICCRALAAIENNANILALIPCEQHTTEK